MSINSKKIHKNLKRTEKVYVHSSDRNFRTTIYLTSEGDEFHVSSNRVSTYSLNPK